MGKIDERERAYRVIKIVSELSNVSVDDILSKSRLTPIVEARRVAMVLLRDNLKLKYVQAGSYFNKDHATVINAVKKHKDFMDVDKNYREYFSICEAAINDDSLLKLKDSSEIIIALTEKVKELQKQIKDLHEQTEVLKQTINYQKKHLTMAIRDVVFSEEWIGTADCDIDPGEPQQWYDSYGDPGHPGTPPSVEVNAVWVRLKDRNNQEIEVDVLPLLHEGGLLDAADIEREIYENEGFED